MAQIKPTNDTPFLAEINMVPMIDVALVLLIIFMVITPQMVLNSIQVSLPRSTSEKAPPSKVISVAIRPDGTVYLNNELVAKGALSDKIKALSPKDLEGALVFSDRAVQVSDVVDVLDQIQAAGVQNVSLTTEKKFVSPDVE